MKGEHPITRRTALRAAGGGLGLGIVGLAGGDSDETVRMNVGYSGPSGEFTLRGAADEVVYEFSFDALTVEVSRSAARDLAERAGVRYVEADTPVYAAEQTLPWGIDRVDAEVAHQGGETGGDDGGEGGDGDDDPAGADIAIIDTGIDEFHPDLQANLGEGVAYLGGVKSDSWQDDNGHGTHCAGIADAIDNDRGVVGVSTAATLHAVKVLTAAGAGLSSDVAKGVEWTADRGYDVGSLSLGGVENDLLRDACEYAVENGVFLAAAAGNAGECTDCVDYPAAYKTVVAVSSTTEDDSLASTSSQGPEVELAAPGEAIYSTFPGGYATLSGTSMACPHVSGAAGQLMDNGSSNGDARTGLRDTAEDIGLSDNEQGAGLLDVAAALGFDSDDDLDGGSESDDTTMPTVTIDGLDEYDNPNPHAQFDVAWSVQDDGGNLESVTIQLSDLTAGEFEDSDSTDASGSRASDTTRLSAHHDDARGHEYEVTVYARDTAGNTGEDSDTITENGY